MKDPNSEKLWDKVEEVMGSMSDDFFPDGKEEDLPEDEREEL